MTPIREQGPTGDDHIFGLSLGIQEMPPGYRLDWIETGYRWVIPIYGTGVGGECDDHEIESEIHWDRWACWAGARIHYIDNGRKPPRTATQAERREAIRHWEIRHGRTA